MKEREEIRSRILKTQITMEKVLEKTNKAELECRRLEQVLTCCFKNPARNDEWERGLEKAIENVKSLITAEDHDIKLFLSEK